MQRNLHLFPLFVLQHPTNFSMPQCSQVQSIPLLLFNTCQSPQKHVVNTLLTSYFNENPQHIRTGLNWDLAIILFPQTSALHKVMQSLMTTSFMPKACLAKLISDRSEACIACISALFNLNTLSVCYINTFLSVLHFCSGFPTYLLPIIPYY